MKIFIVGQQSTGKREVAAILKKYGIKKGNLFTNCPKNEGLYRISNSYQLTLDTINEIFENHSHLFIDKIDNINNYYIGLSFFDYDNNDVFLLTPQDFIQIPTHYFEGHLVVWLDAGRKARQNNYGDYNHKHNFLDEECGENLVIDDFSQYIYDVKNKGAHLAYFFNEEPERVAYTIISTYQHPDMIEVLDKLYK